jgi:hypothetical protein
MKCNGWILCIILFVAWEKLSEIHTIYVGTEHMIGALDFAFRIWRQTEKG